VTNPSTSTPNNPNALKFKVVQGTPAASPSDPSAGTIQASVGAGNPYIILARVSLTNTTTQITNAQITNFSNPIALNVQRLWGGASNTVGHQVPNVADAVLALTSRTDGKVDFAALLSTIFSGQVQTQANAGSAGGTINYVNLGGIKLAWGETAVINTSTTTPSKGITWPTSFFSSAPSVLLSAAKMTTVANQYASIAAINSTTSADIYVYTVSGSGTAVAEFFAIGT
jgi:hypothetical protein